MTYTVVAVYGRSASLPYQRYCDSFEADSPAEAEKLAVEGASDELIVAGVFEGAHETVDEDPTLNPPEEDEEEEGEGLNP